MHKIPLIKPYITDEVKAKVCQVLDSGQLTEGATTREFEALCRQHIGCGHALAVCNCTVGMEMALRLFGVGPGDEVIAPDYTYSATAAVARFVGATIVLVDVDPSTMLIDYDALEAAVTPKTKAIIPVSMFGNPLDYGRLRKIQGRGSFKIIEDAACSIGASWNGKKVGSWADISVFSFHPRKFITTGEGGLVTTDRDDWAKWMDAYKHFGMMRMAEREDIQFGIIGTNFKMSNILAAVGAVQMKHIDELLARREALALRYREKLGGVEGITLPAITPGGRHSWQTCCVFIEDRNPIMKRMRADGIEVQVGNYALHMHPAFQPSAWCRHAGSLANSRRVFDRALALPLYYDLTEGDQDIVIERLIREVRAERAKGGAA